MARRITAIAASLALALAGLLAVSAPGVAAGADDMVLTVTTPAASTTVEMPVKGLANAVVIDWGDSSSSGPLTGSVSTQSHVYSVAGTYTVRISGTSLEGFGSAAGYQGAALITSVTSFGNLGLSDLAGAFYGATRLTDVPASLPASVTRTASMFEGATLFNDADVSSWNTGNVTDMSSMFRNASAFNQPLRTWNTSSVTSTQRMFSGATSFNRWLDTWDTSKVTDMSLMFSGASSFNGLLTSWDTSSVTSMAYMFQNAGAFNRPLPFETGNVTDMTAMFQGSYIFNQPVAFDTSKVYGMTAMFNFAEAFNQPVASWNTSSVQAMNYMFAGARKFNQPVGAWDTSSVTTMANMFSNASEFNQPIGAWDTSSVTSFYQMLDTAQVFNQPLGALDISKVSDMRYMLNYSGLSAANYSSTLAAWGAVSKPRQSGVTLGALNLYYTSEGAAGRAALIAAPSSWTILGDGPDTAAPEVNSAYFGGEARVGSTLVAGGNASGRPAPTLSYQWQYKASGGSWTNISSATKVTYTLPSARYGQTVRVVVTASNGVPPTNSLASAASAVIAAGAPTAPGSVVASPRSAAAVVTWRAPSSTGGPAITGYTVTASPGGRTCTSTGALTCTVTRLTDGTAYRFSVKARNAGSVTGPASTLSAAVTAGAPSEPRSLTVAFPTAGKATVSWVAPVSAGSAAVNAYVVRWLVSGSNTWTPWTAITALSTSRTGLTKGATQKFEVRAHNSVGVSPIATITFTQAK